MAAAQTTWPNRRLNEESRSKVRPTRRYWQWCPWYAQETGTTTFWPHVDHSLTTLEMLLKPAFTIPDHHHHPLTTINHPLTKGWPHFDHCFRRPHTHSEPVTDFFHPIARPVQLTLSGPILPDAVVTALHNTPSMADTVLSRYFFGLKFYQKFCWRP